ncbi:serine hydrolase [Phenylobacterium sp.]|uniref:serine hydrolase domain-containing protein n=1 Tax=Phenylobacterium sp. TaxID=1871053 RepID=UPI001220BD94|nr:serine hydrolase domain-containing protein [Phenylobacterium sp.]THD62731.1 MAG: class A beta-lactamase-related serine hydrolase [Phenylobacterium sp.]
MANLAARLARLAATFLLLLPCVALAQPTATAPARLAPIQSMPPAELEALVDAAVRQAMDRDHIAGVTVAVVQDGKVILKKGYGYADVAALKPVDPDRTLFRVGSITKTFTWLMTLNAIEHGRMRLDAPVNDYLPPKVRVPDHPGYRQVELRDLMTHTPGFEDFVLKAFFLRDPARLQSLDDGLATQRPARVFPPGEVMAYSNYGAALTGDAVAHAEGQAWADLLETEILRPAGMDRTTGREIYPPRPGLPAPMPPALQPDMSRPYHWAGLGFAADPFELVGRFAPAGAISSTAGDMARYMTLLLAGGVIDGHTIYGPGTAQAIRMPMRTYPGDESAIDGGFFQNTLGDGLLTYGHNGATIDFHSDLVLVPALRLGVFVAGNTESAEVLTQSLPGLIVRRFYQAQHPPLPPQPSLLSEAATYQGEYSPARRPFHGLQAFALAFRGSSVSVAAPGYLVLDGERFVLAGPPGLFQDVDNPHIKLRAVIDHGRATKLVLDGGELWGRDVLHENRTLGLAALVSALVAIGVLFGLLSPARWRSQQTTVQRIAGALRAPIAVLLLLAPVLFILKLQAALNDQNSVVYGWPQPSVLLASISGLIAAVLSATVAALTPFTWLGSGGWGLWRKIRFTATVLVFAGFSALLALLGALQPWNP